MPPSLQPKPNELGPPYAPVGQKSATNIDDTNKAQGSDSDGVKLRRSSRNTKSKAGFR